MPESFDGKLVVAISSRALFDLEESNRVFEAEGVEAYYRYQRERDGRMAGANRATYRLGRGMALRGPLSRATERALIRQKRGLYLPVLFEACGEQELAHEYRHWSESYGAFTWLLANVLRRQPRLTWHQLHAAVTDAIIMTALDLRGVRYRNGGSDPSGFDCSGFTRHIFEMSVGLVLPRRADEQAKDSSLLSIRQDELKPGDLVFFNTMKRTFSHVGIYVGEGKFIHAPRTGSAVRVEDMRDSYWAKRFTGARRADLKAAAESGTVTR